MMKKTFLVLVISAVAAGCAGPASLHNIKAQTEANKAQIQKMLPPAAPVSVSPVSYSDRSWIELRKVERSAREQGQEKTDQVQLEVHQQFSSLNDVAGAISSLTGLPVVVASEVTAMAAAALATQAPAVAAPVPPGIPLPMPGAPIPGVAPPGAQMPRPLGATPSGPITPMSPFLANYSGSLTGFMNLVAAYYGVSWKVSGASLRFFLQESRTFRIVALPGNTRLSSSVDSGANTGSDGAASAGAGPTQSASTRNSTGVGYDGLSVWSAMESAIRQMLGTNGRVVASPATGTITVTDTPAVLEKVAEYVDEQNKALNRQVTVNVRVLSVELNEGETYGIQWDVVYANLAAASQYGLGFRTAATSADGVGNLILSAPTSSASRWAGSSAMISALSSQGRVTELTSATLVTLNNQAVPVNIGRRISYLASSSTSQTADVGTTTSLTPGTVNTGFSMSLVPHVIDGKEMLLQYSLDLSSLLRMKTISSGGNTIETPDISTSSFIQRVRLQSNETLVVAGFDQDNLSAVAQGVGHPENTAMGNRNGATKRTMLVILIQPSLSL